MTSRSKAYASAFGRALDEQLGQRGMSQSKLAIAMQKSPSYLNRVMLGKRGTSPQWVDLVADMLGVSPEVRREMHRAGARDAGWKIDH